MKKYILTIVIALTSLFASAQYTMVSNIDVPNENESWGSDNFTSSMGIGYTLNDDYMVGLRKNGDNYDVFVRYSGISDNLYLSADIPTESSLDSARVGVGYSVRFWNNLYVEPNYSVNLNSEGDDKGEFKVGIAYRF
tara:strand:+ start:2698 stop:3108 length:411 start_codon:yes stop_codon:yes gene_type:complete